ARAAVRHNVKYGADWIKVMASGGVLDPFSDYTVQEMSDDQLRAIVDTAHLARRKVMAHAEGIPGIKAAVRAGVDSIEHGTMLDEEGAAMMEQRGTWLVPTLETFQREVPPSSGIEPAMIEKGNAILKFQQPAFARAIAHHLKIAYGLDDEPKYTTREFEALVKGGLTPLVALQAATINAASLLDLSNDAGAIESGKFADIIAIDGDPLRNISAMERVVFVMKEGKVIVSPSVAK